VSIEFPDWNTAERTVADYLLPLLATAERDGEVTCWWYLRKPPSWRLRLHTPGPPASTLLGDTLDTLVARRLITGWRPGRYEPETVAFGGDDAMTIAHRLFHADSRAILTHLPHLASRRRELSLLLCTALLRAARQDWHEQGDIWHRASRLRPLPADVPLSLVRSMTGAVHRLLSTDTTAHNGPLHDLRSWVDDFTRAGHDLADTAQRGALHRGLRDVLAHHIVFHWNRIGIPARTQAILAHAAAQAILHE
jgi:thiopeptide-type bacteriocin biosynthesis domain